MTTKTILKSMLAVAGLGLCIQASAFAAEGGTVATLGDAAGTVMVDHGKGFVTSKAGEKLYENDRVITLEGSSAKVVFADGCAANLKSNNMILVKAEPGCKAAVVDATKSTTEAAAPAGNGGLHGGEYGVGITGAALTGYVVIQILSDEF